MGGGGANEIFSPKPFNFHVEAVCKKLGRHICGRPPIEALKVGMSHHTTSHAENHEFSKNRRKKRVGGALKFFHQKLID